MSVAGMDVPRKCRLGSVRNETSKSSLHSPPWSLSAREYALLHALLLRPGTILTRAELEERLYGWNEEVESNAVDFLIHGVRKKLGADVIKNVRGAGWMVARSDEEKGTP